MVFDIQRFSTHDGNGIRTIIFFKGCPLRCPWCENPESQSGDYEIFYDHRKCIGCLQCIEACEEGEIYKQNGRLVIDRKNLSDPEKLRDVCPAKALTLVGFRQSIADIMQEIEKDIPFYRKSNGGVTLSGGEPYAQPDFLLDLLKEIKKKNIDIAIETSLYAQWNIIEKTIPFIDTFLADLKHTNPDKFKQYTGGAVSLVLDNFKRLDKRNVELVVRVPVIPEFNNSIEEMEAIIEFASSLSGVHEIHFIPFHTLGVGKYNLMEKEYRFFSKAEVQEDTINGYARIARQKQLAVNIGG
jgi:pyruvate formate lyase activating enzyme